MKKQDKKSFSLNRKIELLVLIVILSAAISLDVATGYASSNKQSDSTGLANKINIISTETRNLDGGSLADVGANIFTDQKSDSNSGFLLSNEEQIDFSNSQVKRIIRIPKSAEVKTYIDPSLNQENIIANVYKEKVSKELKRKAEKKSVRVVIEFNLPYKTLLDGDKRKISDFESKKANIDKLIRGRTRQTLKIIRSASAEVTLEELNALEQSDDVEKVWEDVPVNAVLDTSLDEIYARDVWNFVDTNDNFITGKGMRIAIIDTGIDYTHPDLGGCIGSLCKVIGGYDFVTNDNDPIDDNGHGTHVAATAAGNGILKGVAPDANILAYKVLDASGSGYSSWVIAGIERAVDPNNDGNSVDHADVLSMSLGGGGNPDDPMSQAVDRATAAGAIVVVAAGNSGPTEKTIQSPGIARTAITVAAACKTSQVGIVSDCQDKIASFSSRGPVIWNGEDLKKPDVAAPGVLICAARWDSSFASSPTCFDQSHIRISGTSMATPHVAGAAALVKQYKSSLSSAQVKELLKNTARSLGMSYDAQGSGEIDLRAAIPSSQFITASPGSFTLTSDPTKKLTSASQVFTITSSQPIITLSVLFDLPTGVSASSSKSVIQVGDQISDSFQADFTIDNDIARSGSYTGRIRFSQENGSLKGTVPIFITINPTFSVSPLSIDYGFDPPALTTWTSESQTISVQNLRADVAQTLSTSYVQDPGITINAPTSFTVEPLATSTFTTTASADNTILSDGIHTGTFTVSSNNKIITLPTKITKRHVIRLTDINAAEDWNGVWFWIHNRKDTQYFYSISSNPMDIYLDDAGTYDVIINFLAEWNGQDYRGYTIFKEGISVNGLAQVNYQKSDAKHLIRYQALKNDGTTVATAERKTVKTFVPAPNIFSSIWEGGGGSDWSYHYYSDVSPNYMEEDVFSYPWQPSSTVYVYYNSFNGVTGSTTFSTNPSNFKTTTVQFNNNLEGNLRPLIQSCDAKQDCGVYYGGNYVASGTPHTIITDIPSHIYLQHDASKDTQLCPSSGACPFKMLSPYFNPVTGKRAYATGILPWVELPSFTSTLYNGLGPVVWNYAFKNSPTSIIFDSYYTSPVPAEQRPKPAFVRQDFSMQEYNDIPFTVLSNGATVATGVIPSFLFSNMGSSLPVVSVPIAGKYEFLASAPYMAKSKWYNADVYASFDTSKTDPNPPAIQRLYFFTNDLRSEMYDPIATNKLEIEIDPLGGSLSSVSISVSKDGLSYVSANTQLLNGIYYADLPYIASTDKIWLRIEATDDTQNILRYTIEMPAILRTAPLSITKSGAGAGMVSGSGISCGTDCTESYLIGTSVTLSATADVGSTFMGWSGDCAGTGSCTLTMDAAKSANARFELGDGIPPTVTITNPPNNYQLPKTGGVKIQVSASDASGIKTIKIFLDGSLKTTCSGVTSCSYTFNSKSVTTGTHTISAEATDNSGLKNTASITVKK